MSGYGWRWLAGLACSMLAGLGVLVAFAGGPAGAAISTSQVQWDLAGLGYLSFSGIDGIQGPVTTAAVRTFQSDRCLSVDGVVGPQTEGALASVIRQVQSIARTTADGAYGPNTKAAVTSWQSAHRLSADGIAGPQTMAAMGIARTLQCGAPPSGPPGPATSATAQLQWDLAGLGYLPWSGIDGILGPQTSGATEAFQTDRCLSVDGIAGPQTNGALVQVIQQVQKIAGTTADGAYGPNTKAAVTSWQSAHHLSADGIAGPQTMAAMGIARTVACAAPPPPTPAPGGVVYGMDVSAYQGSVNWSSAYANGARFVYIKATESTSYVSSAFSQQYTGSYNAGLIRGAYHFAVPNTSSGAAQADYFVAHGGGWSPDGRTLPGAVDLEWNPYGSSCYGLSQAGMAGWIGSFSNEYHAREGVWPVIYTSTSWWSLCVGNANFASTNPLWVARYASSSGPLPFDWGSYTIWQFADSGSLPGDQDVFNGGTSQLHALACAGRC